MSQVPGSGSLKDAYQVWKWQRDNYAGATLRYMKWDMFEIDKYLRHIFDEALDTHLAPFLTFITSNSAFMFSRNYRLLKIAWNILMLAVPMLRLRSTTPSGLFLQLYFTDPQRQGGFLSLAKKLTWILATVVSPFAWAKLEENEGTRPLHHFISFLSLLNFLQFLVNGRYPTLYERILGLEISDESSNSKVRPFLVDRLIVSSLFWACMKETTLAVIQVFPISVIRSQIMSLWLSIVSSPQSIQKSVPSGCIICRDIDIVIKCQALPCEHIFCYYCISDARLHDPLCPICRKPILDLKICK